MYKIAYGMLSLLFLCSCAGYVDRPVGVCDVLRDLSHYRHEDVTVDGLVMETLEGCYLWDWHGGSQCNELANQGKQWPSVIYLEWTSANDPAIQVALKEIRNKLDQQFQEGKLCGFTARVKGRLDARIWTRVSRNRDSGYYGNGYGVNAASPAKIEVTTIDPVRLISEEEIKLAYPVSPKLIR